MAKLDRAQGSISRTARNMDKVTAECQEEISTRQGRRGSQSDDLSAKVGCLDCKRLLGPKSKSVECDNCNNNLLDMYGVFWSLGRNVWCDQ